MDPNVDKADVELRIHFLKWMEHYLKCVSLPITPYPVIYTQLPTAAMIPRKSPSLA